MLHSLLPGFLGKETEPWLEGMGGLIIYFSFEAPPTASFHFFPVALVTPCLLFHTCAHNGEVGWEQKERVGLSFVWLVFINYWITARN